MQDVKERCEDLLFAALALSLQSYLIVVSM